MDTRRLDNLLASMTRLSASALHLVPGRAPALRVQRRFVAGDQAVVQAAELDELVRDLLFSDHREALARHGRVEVLYVARDSVRHRATVVDAFGERSLVLRPVPSSPPKFETLDLPDQFAGFLRHRSGLVVVAGFYASGKSTTLAAIVDGLNQDPSRQVATVEDAIQFVHRPAAALLHQREVGSHVASAAAGVRQAMACGADVVVVDEVRDGATLEAAIAAAESGCLVFVTVEAGSVVGALSTLANLVAIDERPRLRTRLSRVLRAVTAQALLHRAHKSGRVPVVEVLVGSPAVRSLLRKGQLAELPAIMQRCRGLGMQTADVSLRQLLARHLVTAEEAVLHATNRDEVLARSASGVGPALR